MTEPDGIALFATAQPKAPWWKRVWRLFVPLRLHDDAIETVEIDLSAYQKSGGLRLLNLGRLKELGPK